MTHFSSDPIFQQFAVYAYEPGMVYAGIVIMMLLSAFGLPLPEELTLVSVGILSYMGANPQLFPPPEIGASVVNKYWASVVCVGAIIAGDLLVYYLGKTFGRKLIRHPRMQALLPEEKFASVERWTHKYGLWAIFFLRFSPGVRFPGHFACGLLHYPVKRFMAMDTFAILISVPTQVILIATYGEVILSVLHRFKHYFFMVIIAMVLFFVIRQFWVKRVSAIRDRP
ncbi:MAG: DedA family protein [Pseudobdellovibrionaceae bacterium]